MSILESLGFDIEDTHWQDLAACKNIVSYVDVDENSRVLFDPMFDSYENDSSPFIIRNTIDQLCLSCPVQKICYEYGTQNGEPGVWGGVYLNNGKHDKTRNAHKTKETWKKIRARVK